MLCTYFEIFDQFVICIFRESTRTAHVSQLIFQNLSNVSLSNIIGRLRKKKKKKK